MHKKSQMDAYASEYAMSAGDNSLTRKQIKRSIIAKAMSNEHSHREAFEEYLNHLSD